MVFEHVHPLVLLVWSLAIATAAVFSWLTISNLVSLRRFKDPALRLYAAFTAACALDALLVAGTFMPMSDAAKVALFELLWASAGLAIGLWMRSVARFIGAGDNRLVRILSRLMFGLAVLVLVSFAWTMAGGPNPMSTMAPRDTRSILLAASGGHVFVHGPLTLVISGVAISTMLVAALGLLHLVRRHRPGERFMMVGIGLTVMFAVVQAALAGTDSPYTAPLLFMANLVEAMRITWVSRARIGKELEQVRRTQAEQSLLIEHQLDQVQLADRMARLGETTAQVTHDIRNPLGAVLAGIELAELELDEPEPDLAQLGESLALARASVEHTLTLVRRITKLATASHPSHAQRLALHTLVLDALSLCRQRTQGIELTLEIPDELEVVGRPTELIQLFMNLLVNACDATEALDEAWIRVCAAAGPEFVEISIEDAGLRPAESIRARMFKQRFTTRAEAEGTGLGLSICARIVAQHQGTIRVDPEALHTTIRIELPRG